MDFDKFLTALSKIADKKQQTLPEVVRGVLLAGGPTVNSTKAQYIKFHDDKVRHLIESSTADCLAAAYDCAAHRAAESSRPLNHSHLQMVSVLEQRCHCTAE